MNLKTLAGLCGVSSATVSKAFSGSAEISESTRQMIFDVAMKHGVYHKYNKDRYGKKVIAVICPEINSGLYNRYVTLLEKEITALGGIMTVSVTNFEQARELTLYDYYSSYCKADGIICIAQHATAGRELKIPIVSIHPSPDVKVKDKILGSNCMDDVIGYLKELGHSRIGFIGEGLTATKERRFKDSVRKFLLPIDNEIIEASEARFEEAGARVMDGWFDRGIELPTAIVAAYDYIAIGVIKSIRNHGLSVPRDISVVGMDDINEAGYLETALSTVTQDSEKICKVAAEAIMNKIRDSSHVCSVTIPSVFVPRETTDKARI